MTHTMTTTLATAYRAIEELRESEYVSPWRTMALTYEFRFIILDLYNKEEHGPIIYTIGGEAAEKVMQRKEIEKMQSGFSSYGASTKEIVIWNNKCEKYNQPHLTV